MKLFVNGYGSPMHGWDWFVCGEVRNTKKEAAQDLRELKQKLKQLDELQKQLTDARNALLREGMQRDELLAALNRLYVACPTTIDCQHFHHSKREQHSYLEPCGPAGEYLAAIEQSRAAIASMKGKQ